MHQIAPKKKFGQNFLTDQLVIERIVSIAGQLENKSILEIGGGSGNLTKHLIKAKPKNLIVVEIDKDYVEILSKILQSSSVKTTLISEDILKTDIYSYFSEPPGIFGNFPILDALQSFSSKSSIDIRPVLESISTKSTFAPQ